MTCVETGSTARPIAFGDICFDARIDLREGADRAGDGAGRDFLARGDEPVAVAREFGIGLASLRPKVVGSAWMPCERPIGRRHLVLEGAALERGEQRVDVGDENVGGARELHVEAGVEHVRRGHALMHEARLRPDDLGQMGQEGDDVVLDLALDRVDARDVEGGVLALGPDRFGGVLRDDAELGHGVGGMRLDLEPDAEAGLRRPDRGHLGAGVAGDHQAASPRAMRRRLADRGDVARCTSPPLNTAEPATSTLAPARGDLRRGLGA